MTKEELLKKIDFEKSWLYDCGIFGSDIDTAFHAIKKSVIEVLEQEPKTDTWSIKDVAETLEKHGLIAEQEPCEDAVSRQAVIDIIEKEEFKGDALSEIEKLPSVNPQKIGHWIPDVDKWGDIVTTVNGYRCDKCNTFNADKDNYCPNCGAKMVEPQERSDKE